MTDPQLRAPRSSRAPVPSSLMFVFAISHYQNSQISGASHIGGRSAPASAITYMHSPASSRAIVWPRALPRRGLLPVSVLIGCALLVPPRVVGDFTVWGTFWSPLGVPSVPPLQAPRKPIWESRRAAVRGSGRWAGRATPSTQYRNLENRKYVDTQKVDVLMSAPNRMRTTTAHSGALGGFPRLWHLRESCRAPSVAPLGAPAAAHLGVPSGGCSGSGRRAGRDAQPETAESGNIFSVGSRGG